MSGSIKEVYVKNDPTPHLILIINKSNDIHFLNCHFHWSQKLRLTVTEYEYRIRVLWYPSFLTSGFKTPRLQEQNGGYLDCSHIDQSEYSDC